MTLSSTLVDSGKVVLEFILDILYFPLWWYSRGLFKVLVWGKNFLSARLRGSALGVWVKNLFTPMYGQHDWAGMLISFITRSLQIIVRSIEMLFWLAYVIVVIILWLSAPLYIIYEIIFQLTV